MLTMPREIITLQVGQCGNQSEFGPPQNGAARLPRSDEALPRGAVEVPLLPDRPRFVFTAGRLCLMESLLVDESIRRLSVWPVCHTDFLAPSPSAQGD